jgi:hypothetical protein
VLIPVVLEMTSFRVESAASPKCQTGNKKETTASFNCVIFFIVAGFITRSWRLKGDCIIGDDCTVRSFVSDPAECGRLPEAIPQFGFELMDYGRLMISIPSAVRPLSLAVANQLHRQAMLARFDLAVLGRLHRSKKFPTPSSLSLT